MSADYEDAFQEGTLLSADFFVYAQYLNWELDLEMSVCTTESHDMSPEKK